MQFLRRELLEFCNGLRSISQDLYVQLTACSPSLQIFAVCTTLLQLDDRMKTPFPLARSA